MQRIVKSSRCKCRRFQARRKTWVAQASVPEYLLQHVRELGQWSVTHPGGTWPHNSVKFCKICHNGDVKGVRANVNLRRESVEFFLLHNVFTRLDWQQETVVDKRIGKLWASSSQEQ